VNPQAVPLNLI